MRARADRLRQAVAGLDGSSLAWCGRPPWCVPGGVRMPQFHPTRRVSLACCNAGPPLYQHAAVGAVMLLSAFGGPRRCMAATGCRTRVRVLGQSTRPRRLSIDTDGSALICCSSPQQRPATRPVMPNMTHGHPPSSQSSRPWPSPFRPRRVPRSGQRSRGPLGLTQVIPVAGCDGRRVGGPDRRAFRAAAMSRCPLGCASQVIYNRDKSENTF